MTEQNWAVIDTTQNPQIVINCVSWDKDKYPDYDFHAGHGIDDGLIIVQSDVAGKGWVYDSATQTFSNPNVGDQ